MRPSTKLLLIGLLATALLTSAAPAQAGEIDDYIASGEWEGKAGSYAIQETADRFVSGLEGGGFDNVVGLPVALTLELLGAAPRGAG